MWYVVQTSAGNEISASGKCRRAFPEGSFQKVFVPKYICMKKYQGVWQEECKALFPGYFFVDTDEPETVEEILCTTLYRTASPVCIGKDFAAVYPEEQAFLESMLDENDTVQMSKGDLIDGQFAIRQGPLQKKETCIRRIDRHKRTAEMELTLHGMPKRVKIGLEIVQKVVTKPTWEEREQAGA